MSDPTKTPASATIPWFDVSAQVIEVVAVRFRRGEGVIPDPVRIVTAYFSKDGELLAEHDPVENSLRRAGQ